MGRKGTIVLILALGGIGVLAAMRLGGEDEAKGSRERGPAPVEVASVERGPIELRRTFTGTLEARGRSAVAAHVSGRVQRMHVDLADPVQQGQLIAELDDDDEVQGVAEGAAALTAARANLADAESALQISEREFERLVELEAKGVVSSAELDRGRTQHLARQTAVQVAKARVKSAVAALNRAKIRSGYTRVVATWDGDDPERVVAERHVEEGDTVAAGTPLVTVVGLAPLDAVVYVTEKEYAQLRAGQSATVTADAYPGREFAGTLSRLSPVFSERSRQARLEIEIPNTERQLKPGMFARVEVVLDRVEDATVVPVSALTVRDGTSGVFLVSEDGSTVSWRPVETGIRQDERIQLRGAPLEGRVVTLGHQLIDDGSRIAIPALEHESKPEGGRDVP